MVIGGRRSATSKQKWPSITSNDIQNKLEMGFVDLGILVGDVCLCCLQGCWRAVGASFGKSITFKTTLKGSNMLMKNGLGDLWMPCVCFLGLLASLGFGLHKVHACCVCLVDSRALPAGQSQPDCQ